MTTKRTTYLVIPHSRIDSGYRGHAIAEFFAREAAEEYVRSHPLVSHGAEFYFVVSEYPQT